MALSYLSNKGLNGDSFYFDLKKSQCIYQYYNAVAQTCTKEINCFHETGWVDGVLKESYH